MWLGGEVDGMGTSYQSPLENSFALRLAERGVRGVAVTIAALRARRVARREVACMVADFEGGCFLEFGFGIGELVIELSWMRL